MKLALFFTCNVSLKLWIDTGLFDREKLLYEEYLRNNYLEKVYWLTYGNNDGAIANQLKAESRLHLNIIVLPMPRFFTGKFGALIYSFLMPLFHYRYLKTVDILKTNQMFGSWSAVIAKRLFKKLLLVRAGYALSWSFKKQGESQLKNTFCEWIERFAYKYANRGIVASHRDKQYICSKYHIPHEKIEVIYNYINTKIFRPINCEKCKDRVIYVGRLTSEKNLFNLIEAVQQIKLTLDIYGQGPLKETLQAHAHQRGANVNFNGIVPNNELPQILNRYRYFVLPSLYEGMPKSLLEAMACGLVCIGTDVEGIDEIIENNINGYLAKSTDTADIAKTIDKAISLSDGSIPLKAVEKIRDKFSLAEAVTKENGLFSTLIK